MTAQLRGVLTALATPFTENGNIDEGSLQILVNRSIAGGVHGVVACGSTGEFSTLSSDERRLCQDGPAPGSGCRSATRRWPRW